MRVAARIYAGYYISLSHFFAYTNAFTLTRHVRADEKVRRSPAYPWAHRPPVRLADGCTGVLAAAIARKTGRSSAGFLNRYGEAHLDRGVVPAFALAARGWWRLAQWRKVPAALGAVYSVRRYLDGPGRHDDAARREARIREGFTTAFRALGIDHDEMFRLVIDEFIALVLARASASSSATSAPPAPPAQ